MPQLRKDPITGRWVIVDVENPKKPEVFDTSHYSLGKVCPFCPGNEAMTPSEIMAVRPKLSQKNSSGWSVRVVPNKFPALKIEESTEKKALGIYDKIGGFGAHEVIIENPDHGKQISDLDLEQVAAVLKVYKERCLDLRKDPRMKYILIFKNVGATAGASLDHTHSQLIALPIVPSRVLGEVKGSQRHFEFTDRCIYCDMLSQEESEKRFIVYQEGGFMALEPFASRFPFETWILPKSHEASFDSISDEKIMALAGVLKTVLSKIKIALHDPSYNFMIHTLPIFGKEADSYHWHIEIIPHLTRVAGFELGTGFYLNPTPPELAADILRSQET